MNNREKSKKPDANRYENYLAVRYEFKANLKIESMLVSSISTRLPASLPVYQAHVQSL